MTSLSYFIPTFVECGQLRAHRKTVVRIKCANIFVIIVVVVIVAVIRRLRSQREGSEKQIHLLPHGLHQHNIIIPENTFPER